jgi:uncharacterized protein YkwD
VARRVPTGVAVAVAVLIFVGVANAAPTAALTQAESSLLSAMNSVRLANGLQPLRADGRLEVAARSHSTEMLRTGTFAHGAFVARIRGAGVRTPRIGENIAWSTGGVTVAHSIVEAWLASPEHRANLLHPGYRLVGVGALRGCFDGRRHTLMVTTDFAGR